MFKLVLEKAEEPEIKLPTSIGSSKKQESSRKTTWSALLICQSLCVDHNKLENFSRDGHTRPPDLPLEVRKQQLELDMEQQTGSQLGKEYVKAVYCHPAYLTHMQSTS